MSDGTLVECVKRQFGSVQKMLRQAIKNCPSNEWRVGRQAFFMPGRLAFHVVQATDFHLDADAKGYDWNRFGVDWAEAPAERLLSEAQVLAYLDEVEAKVNRRLDELGSAGLLAADYAGSFPSALDHVLYTLRHAEHHTGQINAELKSRGLQPAKWR